MAIKKIYNVSDNYIKNTNKIYNKKDYKNNINKYKEDFEEQNLKTTKEYISDNYNYLEEFEEYTYKDKDIYEEEIYKENEKVRQEKLMKNKAENEKMATNLKYGKHSYISEDSNVKNKDVVNKKEKTMAESKNDMQEYISLIRDGLYDESFMLLEEKVQKIESKINKNKYIRDFFVAVFDVDFFHEVLTGDKILPLAESMVMHLSTKDFLKEMSSKLPNFVDISSLSIIFALLLQNNKFDYASFMLPYVDKDITTYTNTLANIIKNNNVEGLRFMCENMNNIQFDDGGLLKMASGMKARSLKMLIEEFEFDINEPSKESGLNLIQTLVENNNVKNFKYIIANYSDTIDWNASIIKKGKPVNITYFDMVEQAERSLAFHEQLLEDQTLKAPYVERIAGNLLNTDKAVVAASKTDVYYKLFSHPNFDPQVVNWDQGYFIYGVIAKLDATIAKSGGEEMAKSYLSVLEAYLSSYPEDEVPKADNYHILGAATHIAGASNSKIMNDAAIMIMKRYSQYINEPNPNGVLPINQVSAGSPMYRALINNGAIPANPEPAFWSSFWKREPKKEVLEAINQRNQALNIKNKEVSASKQDLIQLNNSMRDSFRGLRELINDDLCDPVIKFTSENMFLKATKVVNIMIQYDIVNSYEDSSFLSNNFSKYLKNTLQNYINICRTTEDIADSSTDEGLLSKDKKIKEAKSECLKQIDLLSKQVQLISDNALNYATNNAQTELKVNGRFLRNKFKDNEVEEETPEAPVTIAPKKLKM